MPENAPHTARNHHLTASHLTDSQWNSVWEVFDNVSALPAGEWTAALDSQNADPAVRAQVLRMLEELEEGSAFEDKADGSTIADRAGSKLGKYEVKELLGRGGMGDVYSGTDESLGRPVAIKFLSTEANSREQVERFVSEARAASTFNHPNIVTIYDFARGDDGTLAIVMERIEGQTLRSLLPPGGFPLKAFAGYAQQLASALAAAHARGIVHRDVKPDNMMIRADGVVKLLDFGIARLVASAGEQDGVRLRAKDTTVAGTPRYMAPEQAGGRAPGLPSDIFSLGLVFCEMVTGRLPFEEMTEISAVAMTATVDTLPGIRGLSKTVPVSIVRLIDRMLAIDPAERPPAAEVVRETERWNSGAPLRTRWLLAAGLALALVTAALVYWRFGSKEDSSAQLLAVPLTSYSGEEIGPSFDPSGENIVFAWSGEDEGNFDIYTRPLHGTSPRRLTAGPAQEYDPVWSHDGRTIAFRREIPGQRTAIVLMSPQGTNERILATTRGRAWHYWHCLDWSPDDRWLAFADLDDDGHWAIYLLSAGTGEVHRVAVPAKEVYIEPAFSPDGKRIAFIADLDGANRLMMVALTPDHRAAGEPAYVKLVGHDGYITRSPRWSQDGRRLLFVSNKGLLGSVYEAIIPASLSEPIRPRRLGTLGESVLRLSLPSRGIGLGFTRIEQDINIYRLRPPATGELDRILGSTRVERFARLSPDGRFIAFESERSGYPEIWLAAADGSDPFPLTDFHGPVTGSPAWSPDSQQIAFDTRADGQPEIYVIDAVRGAVPRNISHHPSTDILPAWSADGRFVYFNSNRTGIYEIWRVPATGAGQGEHVGAGFAPALSADGKWLYNGHSNIIRRMPVNGGATETVGEAFDDRAYAVTASGVLFLEKRDVRHYQLKLWDAATRRTSVVRRLDGYFDSGISASADGQTILLHKWDAHGSDLMMVTAFR